jgi:hypothetical protein
MLDTYPSGYLKVLLDAESLPNKFDLFVKRMRGHFSNLKGMTVVGKFRYAVGKLRYAPCKLKTSLWQRAYRFYENLGRQVPRALRDVSEFNSMARRNYVPQVFGGRVTLFWASEDLRASFDLVEGWQTLAGGGMDVHEVSGSHLDIIKEPHVAELAVTLQNCLALARRQPLDSLPEKVRTSIPTEQRKVALRYPKLQRAS